MISLRTILFLIFLLKILSFQMKKRIMIRSKKAIKRSEGMSINKLKNIQNIKKLNLIIISMSRERCKIHKTIKRSSSFFHWKIRKNCHNRPFNDHCFVIEISITLTTDMKIIPLSSKFWQASDWLIALASIQ